MKSKGTQWPRFQQFRSGPHREGHWRPHAGLRTVPSRRLTSRSTGHATAWHPGRAAALVIIGRTARATRRCVPVNFALGSTTATFWVTVAAYVQSAYTSPMSSIQFEWDPKKAQPPRGRIVVAPIELGVLASKSHRWWWEAVELVGEGRRGGQRVLALSTASRPVREAHRPQIHSFGAGWPRWPCATTATRNPGR